ncbi:MAG: hypothetical protein J6V66_00765 [Clostridia bacterium]|nr:hypothetical protein [Clostridia bacterium]
MIELKELASDLQSKLNSNTQSLDFAIFPDTTSFIKSYKVRNTVHEVINGLLTVQTSDLSNLTDGEVFATISARLQVIFRLKNHDEDIEVPKANGETAIKYGNNSIVAMVREALTTAFQTQEQKVLTDSDGKNYLVSIIYQLVETGERNQVAQLGDCFTFTVYIAYMFVENGINTRDITYTLDGKVIPFQANTVLRTPTTDGNVYADTTNGAVKNLSSQSLLDFSFELPSLRNEITNAMYKWLFGGELNVAHILNVRMPDFPNGFTETNYLVTYGATPIMGETIKNIGQKMTLVEICDDYELVGIPDDYYIYYAVNDLSAVELTSNGYFYNFGTKEFGKGSGRVDFTVKAGDFIMSTQPINTAGLNPIGATLKTTQFVVDVATGELSVIYPEGAPATFEIVNNELIVSSEIVTFSSEILYIQNGQIFYKE